MLPPIVNECYARLHWAGWSIGDAAAGSRWFVTGTNGDNAIRADARTQFEAWRLAVEQAAAAGMVRT
ncbi:MAG TPA: hypothetical protein VGF55_17375 [Gemmataceae bacterium]